MATTWIVSGDSSRARVLQVTGRHSLQEVEEFDNPKGRMDEREFIADDVELFAKKIDRFLDQARKENRYDQLVVLAPPKFLGLLRRNLNKEVGRMVREDIDRDLSWLDTREIDRYLRNGRRPA